MANFCSNCGSKLDGNPKFCSNCGATVTNTASALQQSAANSPPTTAPATQDVNPTAAQHAMHAEKPQKPLKKPCEKRRPVAFRVTACALVAVMSITAAFKLISNSRVIIAPYDATGAFVCNAVYSEKDIEKAKEKTATVSSERCEAKAGDITVDFSEWNLEGEDELIVKKLPALNDKATGCTVKGYDISLASGRHSFYTDVAITIPRTAENGEVYYYNEASGKWEYFYSEVSGDGKNYTAYTDHFSQYAEIISDKGNTNAGDYSATGALFREVNLYDNTMMNPVVLDDNAFRALCNRDVTDVIEEIKRSQSDSAELENTMARSDVAGHIGNAAGVTDTTKILEKLPEGIGGKLIGCVKIIDVMSTAIKISDECSEGKNLTDVAWDNALDILGAGAGMGELIIIGVGGPPAWATKCVIAGAFLLSASLYCDYAPERMPATEQVYRAYVAEHGKTIQSTYMPQFSEWNNRYALSISGKGGWNYVIGETFKAYSDRPDMIDEAVVDIYYSYAGSYWNLPVTERAEYDKYYRDQLNLPDNDLYTDPDYTQIEKMKSNLIKEVMYNTRDVLEANAATQRRKATEELRRTVTDEMTPLLNTKIVISITDPNVRDGKYFDSSDYAGKSFKDYRNGNTADFPMMFTDSSTALFTPVGKTISDYPYELFVPKARKDSNVVFECTLYHYMMMDSPTTIRLNAVNDMFGKEKLSPITLNFALPEPSSDGVIHVDLTVPSGKGEVRIDGDENITVELSKDELPYSHTFRATAKNEGEYRFEWNFDNGSGRRDTCDNSSSVNAEFDDFGTYNVNVTLYDLKEKRLDYDSVTLVIKEKSAEAITDDKQTTEGDTEETDVETEAEYVWRFKEVVDYPMENAAPNPPYNYYDHKYTYARGSYNSVDTVDKVKISRATSFSLPPQHDLKPGEKVEITMSASHQYIGDVWAGSYASAQIDVSGLEHYVVTARAIDFLDKDGNFGVETDSTINSDSKSGTYSAEMPETASNEGDTISIYIRGCSQQTEYVYEWAKVSSDDKKGSEETDEPKYAWVRVGEGEKRYFYDHQESGDYSDDYTMDGGGFTVLSKYECKECAACQRKGGHIRSASASVTPVPTTLYADETITFSMVLEANSSDCRLGVQNVGFEAKFNGVGFADDEGTVNFSTDAMGGVTQVSKQLSAKIKAGKEEGDTAELKYSYLGGRVYAYTYVWTKVG